VDFKDFLAFVALNPDLMARFLVDRRAFFDMFSKLPAASADRAVAAESVVLDLDTFESQILRIANVQFFGSAV
jgi:hypothetical protein